MPQYRFRAKKGPEEIIEGTVAAENRAEALSKISTKGYIPIAIHEKLSDEPASSPAAASSRKERIPPKQLNVLTRQFASLVRSGVPLLRALNILAEQAETKVAKAVLHTMAEAVRKGDTISESMELFPNTFSPMYISLIKAGEVGGVLDEILERLAAKADKDDQIRNKIQGALAYPAFVGLTGLGTVIFLMSFVMPRMLRLFDGFGQDLPLATRMLISSSAVMSRPLFWVSALVVVILFCAAWAAPRSPLREAFARFVYKLPLFGKMSMQVEMARFTRSFGMLLDHGVSVIEAIEVALSVVHNPVIRKALEGLPGALEQGSSLAKAFEHVAVASPFIVNTVAVGEEGGKAGEALLEIAVYYEREVERTLDVMAALLEPLMVVLVGVIVGWIVMAVLLPVFEMGSIF